MGRIWDLEPVLIIQIDYAPDPHAYTLDTCTFARVHEPLGHVAEPLARLTWPLARPSWLLAGRIARTTSGSFGPGEYVGMLLAWPKRFVAK